MQSVESRRVSVPIARVTILCMNAPHPPTHHAPHAPVQFARALVHPCGPTQSPLALHVSRRRHPPSSAQGEPPGLGLVPAGERGEGDVDGMIARCGNIPAAHATPGLAASRNTSG